MSDITTAELVNLLRVRAGTQNKRGYSGEASEWLELADLIESLQAQLAASQRRERAAVEMAACDSVRWIPVTERLPLTEKPVQVYMPKLYMSVQTGFYTKYYGEDDGEWYEHWVASGDVTHWRPLPAPPEEGAERE